MGLCTVMLIFLFGLISTDATLSIDMCENSETPNRPNDDKLDLIAIGPTTENMSKSCSCLINATSDWNIVSIKISREDEDILCFENLGTLEIIRSGRREIVTLQRDRLSNYSSRFASVLAIRFNITLHSSCGSNYTIRFKESSHLTTEFSQVTCSYTQVITTPPSSEASTVAVTSRGDFPTESESTYSPVETYSPMETYTPMETNSPMETYSQTDVQTSIPSPNTSLIVGIVVGVAVGLLLIGIIVFCGCRAKHQRKTDPNTNSPTPKSSDPDHQGPASPDTLACQKINSFTQGKTGTGIDNHNVTIDPSAVTTDENFYDTCVPDNEFRHFNVSIDRQAPTSDEVYEEITPQPSSSIDNDTTLIENDLYS